jgi:Putative methyltransferase
MDSHSDITTLSAEAIYSSSTKNVLDSGVCVTTVTAKAIKGEHERRGLTYLSGLWAVSILAMVSNFSKALYVRGFKSRQKSIAKILWEMGRNKNHISSIFVDRFSRFNRQAKYGAAGWMSLDVFYNYHENIKPRLTNNIEGKLTRFWIGKMENRQAVTNRLKLATVLIAEAISKHSDEREIRLISLASGSAQAVLQAISKQRNSNIKVILIDSDRSALSEAERNVTKAGLRDRFTFVQGTTKKLEQVCGDFRPHIIEMIGLLDYRPREKAIHLIQRIRECLVERGTFLTCNIRHNREKLFIDWVLLWPMIYRDENTFAELMLQGGFLPEEIHLLYEPFRIHGIAVCRKKALLSSEKAGLTNLCILGGKIPDKS